MEVGYFVKSLGETLEDVRYFISIQGSFQFVMYTKYILVEKACMDAWKIHEGNWIPRGDDIITLVVDGEEVGDFAIDMDFDPNFYIRETT